MICGMGQKDEFFVASSMVFFDEKKAIDQLKKCMVSAKGDRQELNKPEQQKKI